MAKWKNNLVTLNSKGTARCLKPESFSNVVNCTLYHFSDHVKMDMASLAISDCLMKVVKYTAPY